MDAVEGILVAVPEIKRAGANWIFGATFHSNAALQLHHVLSELGLPLQHFCRRIPVRPFLFGVNGRPARPDEAHGAYADTVADRFSAALYQIKEMTGRIDSDRARRLMRRVGNSLPREGRICFARRRAPATYIPVAPPYN